MRIKACWFVLAAAFVACPAVSHACERIESCDLRSLMTPEEFQEFARALKSRKRQAERRAQAVPASAAILAPRTLASRPPGTRLPAPATALNFYLRQDFPDVTLFTHPTPTADAAGAEFSYTRDNVLKDTTLAGTGLVAVAYSYLSEDIYDPFIGATFAPYFSFQREIHSRLVNNNEDTRTIGVSGEVGFQNPLFRGSDYFRGAISATRDEIAGTTNSGGRLEWLPTYLWAAGSVPGTYINYNIMPQALVQYDSTPDGNVLAFSGRNELLRVGPQVHALFRFYGPSAPIYDFIRRFSGNLTYHWWTELHSGRTGSWFETSMTYNLDEAGHLGLKLSYKRGRTETIGAPMDLYKITLSAKL